MVGSASIGPRGYQHTSPATELPEMAASRTCIYVCPFPRLEEVHHEPWREWNCTQRFTDRHEYCCNLPKLLLALIRIVILSLTICIRYLDL